MTAAPSRELMRTAMSLGEPERVPVMCQLAIGHTLIQTGVDPFDFFHSNEAYADALLRVRELYNFDGILIHKPGRVPWDDLIDRVDRGGSFPVVHLRDGARIECRADDDPYFRMDPPTPWPEFETIDPENPWGWAPPAFQRWSLHKGSAPLWRRPEDFPDYYYGCIDRVRAAVGDRISVHGEVRAPLDHMVMFGGIENAMIAILTAPEHAHRLMASFAEMAAAWAVAQVRRGCDAIKISSPFAGGGFLSPDMYREWIVPYESVIAAAVRDAGAFVYTHTCGIIGDRLDLMVETGIHGIETLDPPPLGTVDLFEAKQLLRDRLFIKGNVDPVNGLWRNSTEGARETIERVFEIGRQGGQYVLSTACSVAPPTPPERVRMLAEVALNHAG